MKELSIEEKAKAYDEAFKEAEKIHNFSSDIAEVKRMEQIFPELKESDDDRIRKDIVFYIAAHHKDDGEKARWLYWLEKQGEQKPQGKSALEGINEIKADNANKVEPKDYRSIDPHFFKTADKVEPKFKIGDIIRFKGNETLKGEAETHKIVSYDNELYVFADGTTDLFCEQDLYELVKQKPANKVEPKFKVGDWITNSIETVQITGYDIDYGYQVDYKSNLQHRDTDIIEKEYHHWTIQDAKPGDVLVDVYGNIGIFEKIYGINWLTYCYLWNEELFVSGGGYHGSICYPATKEQRDTLEKAMTDAGYKWNKEDLKLEKI